jgi:hypothetical protein
MELVATVFLAQLAKRLLFDLPHPLTREIESLTYFLESERMLSADTEVQSRNLRLTRMEHAERSLDVDLERLLQKHVIRRVAVIVWKNVEEAVVVVLVKRGVHGKMSARVLHRLAHLLNVDLEFLCEFLDVGRPVVLLRKLRRGLADLRDRPNPVERKADYATLLGKRLEDRLPNPSHCVRNELEAPRFIK